MARHVLIGALVLMLGACVTLSRDQRLNKDIIGSWIVAGDSSDYRPVPMHERFFRDGTYWIFWFSDATCTRVIGETHLTWKIKDGILTSRITDATNPTYGHVGDVMESEIISLTAKRMVLRSLDDGTTYTRERSTHCLAAKQTEV